LAGFKPLPGVQPAFDNPHAFQDCEGTGGCRTLRDAADVVKWQTQGT
jgi:hypothetical protein